MARVFMYDGRPFPDPDPALSVEDVRGQLSEFFPELANAETREERRGGDTVFTFTRRIGTKGTTEQPHGALVASVLRRVPPRRLAIFDLALVLLDEHARPNLDALAAQQPALNLAQAEAEAYARATQHATEAVRRLPAR